MAAMRVAACDPGGFPKLDHRGVENLGQALKFMQQDLGDGFDILARNHKGEQELRKRIAVCRKLAGFRQEDPGKRLGIDPGT